MVVKIRVSMRKLDLRRRMKIEADCLKPPGNQNNHYNEEGFTFSSLNGRIAKFALIKCNMEMIELVVINSWTLH